ncbi:MAG: hypothetical protein HOQ24_04495, partial [Mycobacteriaceae bacterium]|nr:hypothetical protein [Mycobacteriaceae bacterium]
MTRHQAPQPPYPTELLADLHADNLPTEVAAQLWPRVRQDPDAMSVITALDAVQDRLHALGQDHNVATPIPDD